jgi:predicted kinase
MPTLHLICGLPGSGKSTLARKLEGEKDAVRLTPDEWLMRLQIDGCDEKARSAIEAIQWDLAQRMLELGVNVVLESGFWSREERMRIRRRATELGVSSQIHYLDVPRAELIERLSRRNAALPEYTVRVDPNDLDTWIAAFDAPTPDELG